MAPRIPQPPVQAIALPQPDILVLEEWLHNGYFQDRDGEVWEEFIVIDRDGHFLRYETRLA